MVDLVKNPGNFTPSSVQEAQQVTRAMSEVQAQVILAKKYPRNVNQAVIGILEACKRDRLANLAIYRYPRGGQQVSGPSIRLAEVLASSWGNISYGVRELECVNGESTWEAYCWDLETNVKVDRQFSVKHELQLKDKSIKKLTDPRDVYEIGANYAARRLRACILEVIPGWVVDEAMEQCRLTLTAPGSKSLADTVLSVVKAFKDLGVSQEMIEKRLGHSVDLINAEEMAELRQIFTSLKDNMAKREDFFDHDKPKTNIDFGTKAIPNENTTAKLIAKELTDFYKVLVKEGKTKEEIFDYIGKKFTNIESEADFETLEAQTSREVIAYLRKI